MFRNKSILILLIIILTLALTACGNGAEQQQPEPEQPTVIEPGQPDPGQQPEEPEEPAAPELFPDKGEATTVEDLSAAQAKIDSYYFEQTVQFPDGHMFMQVWYIDDMMKVATSVDGVSQSEFYYDYANMTVTTYYPGVSRSAMMLDFDASSPDAPENPKIRDYSACVLVGAETVNRQYCLILETADGSKLWVGTRYGFPMQAEYTDSLGDLYTIQYKNISINTVDPDEVLIPADLPVDNFSSSANTPAAEREEPEQAGEMIPDEQPAGEESGV